MSLLRNRFLRIIVVLMVIYLVIHTGGYVPDRELRPVNPSYGITRVGYAVEPNAFSFPDEMVIVWFVIGSALILMIIGLIPANIMADRTYNKP